MKRLIGGALAVSMLLSAACAPIAAPAPAPAEATLTAVAPGLEGEGAQVDGAANWDAVLNGWIGGASDFCDAPGDVLLVDSPTGRYLKAAGVADLESQQPVATGDRFEIGSNTKAFTVVLALQLAEEGLLDMDARLADYLPDVAAQVPNGDVVTLRQLAGNVSGIRDYADPIMQPMIDVDDQEGLAKPWMPAELVDAAIAQGDADFAPGEGWQYSSTNFILLGMVVEAVTGRPLADLYQERIFAPLGMAASEYLTGSPEPRSLVEGYYNVPGLGLRNMTNWNASQAGAAGAIVSTAEDVARFAAGLREGRLFKDAATLDEMLTFRDLNAAESGGAFFGYGLGLIRFTVGDQEGYGHGGQTPGFQTLWFYLPDTDTTLVLLTNSGTCQVLLLPILNGDCFGPAEADAGETEATMAGVEAGAVTPAPSWVQALEAVFGPPSQAAFGSAVFHVALSADASLEEAAQRAYRTFVGNLWDQYGEAAWLGPWAQVYARPVGAAGDIVAELAALEDGDVASAADVLINGGVDTEGAEAALTAAADAPVVTDLQVWRIGDGEAMSGIVVGIRRASAQIEVDEATFVVFLMD